MSLVSLIPAFPLLGFIINGLFGKHVSKLTSGILGAGSILIAFVLALICFINQHPGQANEVILFSMDTIGLNGYTCWFINGPLIHTFYTYYYGYWFFNSCVFNGLHAYG